MHLVSKSILLIPVVLSVFCGRSTSQSTAGELVLFDFTKSDDVVAWQEQSDTVRNVGMSKANLVLHQNVQFRRAIFFALLNPQSDGSAFAGMRVFKEFNLAGYTKLQIQCRGQGQYNGFKIVLRHKGKNNNSDNTFEQTFQAPKEFGVQTLPLSEFKAFFRGREVNNETLDVSRISAFGLQTYGGVFSSVKQEGPATLEVDWIKAIP
ncbi:complex I intermediate-associated protein 30 (CIA30) domain-containing protein [Phthorimaea operculella]|nr:complex I intermediate-associated protein 30 (CIA30) domain-containing protein [Phthorimaea operculella]